MKKLRFSNYTLAALGLAAAVSLCSTAFAEGIAGKGSIGASAGVMKYTSGDDWKDGSTRLIFNAVIKYNVDDHWAFTLEGGAGWNNFGTSLPDSALHGTSDTLGVVYPLTIGAEYRLQLQDSKIWPHFGAGVGLYNLGIKDGPRTWARNTSTGEQLLWSTFGFWGKVGAEYLFNDSVSMNFDALMHFFDATDDNLSRVEPGDEYLARFTTSSTSFLQMRIGVNYYFSVGGGGGEEVPAEETEDDDLLEGLD